MSGAAGTAGAVGYFRILLPEIVLTVSAVIVLLVDVFQRGTRRGPSGTGIRWLAVLGVLLSAGANATLLSLGPAGPDALMALDGFRVAANFIILGATLLGLLFSFDYLRREGLEIGEFYALVLLASVGMMILSGAQDLVLIFLGLEMMSISVYVLTGFDRENPRSAEAGLKYFLIGAFASAFFIYGVALLYGATGTTHLVRMALVLSHGHPGLLTAGGAALLVIGFGFKVSAVPFHAWAPDAYQGAPTPVTGYMASGVKAAALLAFFRVLWVGLGSVQGFWHGAIWWLAVLTMVVPNLVALVQDDVKRMLAYSSVAHAGYLLVGVAAGGTLGRGAALFYLVVYTLMTVGAFGIVYLVAGKGDRHSHLADFRGLGWRRPWVAGALGIFLLSLAGFPPTGGFVGKLYLLRAAVSSNQSGLAIILVLTSLVAYYYYLRVVWKMYFEEAPEDAPEPDLPGGAFRLGAAVCALGVLAAGIWPGPTLHAADSAALGGSRFVAAGTARVDSSASSTAAASASAARRAGTAADPRGTAPGPAGRGAPAGARE